MSGASDYNSYGQSVCNKSMALEREVWQWANDVLANNSTASHRSKSSAIFCISLDNIIPREREWKMGKPAHSMDFSILCVNDSETGSQGHQMEMTSYYSECSILI